MQEIKLIVDSVRLSWSPLEEADGRLGILPRSHTRAIVRLRIQRVTVAFDTFAAAKRMPPRRAWKRKHARPVSEASVFVRLCPFDFYGDAGKAVPDLDFTREMSALLTLPSMGTSSWKLEPLTA